MATNGSSRPLRDVTLFATPDCHWCKVAEDYFQRHGIAYRKVDITKDRRGLKEMVLMTGGRAVPVIRVDAHAMVGWDVREFEKLMSGRFKRR